MKRQLGFQVISVCVLVLVAVLGVSRPSFGQSELKSQVAKELYPHTYDILLRSGNSEFLRDADADIRQQYVDIISGFQEDDFEEGLARFLSINRDELDDCLSSRPFETGFVARRQGPEKWRKHLAAIESLSIDISPTSTTNTASLLLYIENTLHPDSLWVLDSSKASKLPWPLCVFKRDCREAPPSFRIDCSIVIQRKKDR